MRDKIYLAQTDTTVGFLSKSFRALNEVKKRPLDTPCLKSVARFEELKKHARVPNTHKNLVRKARKITFIYPNKQSIRIVKDCLHEGFILKHKWLYSTSANITKQGFDEKYARSVAHEICEEKNGFLQKAPSIMLKLGKIKIKKIRS